MIDTIPKRIREWARAQPELVALREKQLGIWQEVTWSQYWERSLAVAGALVEFGIQPGDRIAVHSENRQEWLYADIGIEAARAITVGIYPTSPTAEVLHFLRDSGARLLIVEDQEQLDKSLEVIDQLPALEQIVYLEPRGIDGSYADERLVSWDEFVARGDRYAAGHRAEIDSLVDGAKADDAASFVYTSGTTGAPKGAMLSVGNLEFVAELMTSPNTFFKRAPSPRDLYVSYLPLCHVAERMFTVWMNAAGGAQVNFAESIDTVQANLREIQPTILLAVPRIWEKILASVRTNESVATPLKRLNLRVWLRVADWIGHRRASNNGRHTLGTRIAYAAGWSFLFRALRERLGLSRVRFAVSGAAPIAREVLEFFTGIGVPIYEIYGSTESSAIATVNRPGNNRLGTVGEPQERTEVRLAENGEILTRSPGTFLGYWGNPVATAEAIDADGWLHSGDVGEWVDGTHLRITDRIKDIIITAGGKNISPSEIENALKASQFIKEAVVIGDRRKYLTALVGIELEVVGTWARERGITYTSYRTLSEKPEVLELVQGIIERANKNFASVATIKDFRMFPRELDQDLNEVTATQKVKRSTVAAAFSDLVESMYGGPA